MENPENHKNENDPFDPLTLFGAKRSCGIDYISAHYHRKGQKVKKVMCFSLNRIANVKLLTCIKIGGRWLVIGFWVGLKSRILPIKP